ncbi:unnamed protein product [Ceutorhynchus assimilis]|uniref:WD repeat-containing protein 63 n=1 Tax=Ceutorhynchus assimilis TaxID=467358 RepID=A0A9N9MNR2_9CUCU|nr:unnamed protein product [Ceutorhynchus assimilis]
MGYIADETVDREDEDFYICLTAEATDTAAKMIEQLQKEQDERLHYQLFKDIHPWASLGSEPEIDEAILKNNRALIEVEVETRYPIFPGKVQFRYVKVEQKRDGYMELRSEEAVPCVYRRRIHTAIQAAPPLITTEIQTDCTYPSNAACQYLYDPGSVEEILLQCEPEIINYANRNLDDLSNVLMVSGSIDFHRDDFNSLIRKDILSGDAAKLTVPKEYLEYMSFMDVDLAQGKMISDIYWHRMWSGIVAISYCDVSPNIFFSGNYEADMVERATFTPNLVLIWSFLDALKPKLILEAPREIYKLSFCKFDENILIGGCKNGQIIIWDLRNRLQKVEQEEILTAAQQKYRTYMFEMMGWMKNTYDMAVVRPTAVSDLRFSHRDEVSGISWVDPNYEFTRTGQIAEIATDENERPKYSMQLVTSSIDGSILIWDLKMKQIYTAGGYKVRKLKRLKERPDELQSEVSPYRVLHLNLKPKYRINMFETHLKTSVPICITRSNTGYCLQTYAETNSSLAEEKKKDFDERYFYKPILQKSEPLQPIIRIGTVEGDYAEITWDGQDFDSGETVNCEHGSFRLFHIKKTSFNYPKTIEEDMKTFIEKEIYRKKAFLKWQEEFNLRNEEYQAKLKVKAEKRAKEEAAAREAAKEERKTVEKEVRKGPEPGKYVEWIIEQRQAKEEARIKAMIINKKQLDTKDLEKRRKPLEKLDEENARKKKKQRDRLKQGKMIFEDQVEALFPAILRKKTPPPQDPYAGGDSDQAKRHIYEQYNEIVDKMERYVAAHPFRYQFDFKTILIDGRNKEDKYMQMHEHKKRYDDEKQMRKREESIQSITDYEEVLPVEEETEAEENFV